MSFLAELPTALRRHWPHYLAEAAGLAFFIICASLLTLALEHPASPLHGWLVRHGAGDLLRRIPLGLGMGLVIVAITYSPWGKKSGAHINPAVTLAFWQLGKIRRADATWYVVAQAAGGIGAAQLLKAVLGAYYAHPSIHFATTRPGPAGAGVAFVAEFVISFVLIWVLLEALHSAQLKPVAGWLMGALLACYVIWEAPISGMSLNPFRSLAADIAAGEFDALWVYILAPTAAMWLATWLFQHWRRPKATSQEQASTTTQPTEPPQYPDPTAV